MTTLIHGGSVERPALRRWRTRLAHYETNIVVQCQDEKSQHKNFAKALRNLKTRL